MLNSQTPQRDQAPAFPTAASPLGRRSLRVTSKALPEHNRRHNRSLILQTLFHGGSMSRADLARESGLTRVTVSDLVSELASEGIIQELGPRTGARVGKPARMIGIDENAYTVIALDLSADDRFVGTIVTLRGAMVHRLEVPIAETTGGGAVELALALARDLLKRATVRILGIGIGTPGIVGHDGVVREAPNLGWVDVDLAGRFRAEFGVPIHVGNDANAAALAIHTFRESSAESLMVVTIEHGVGAGLIIGGALVEGEQFTAGEIGHVVVDETGDACACGRIGCLELAIAVPRLKRRLADAPASDRDSVLADAGRALGVAIAPVISALNLNEVVLSGPADLVEGAFLDSARDTIRARTLSAVSNGLDMSLAQRSDELVLLGATVLVLSAELGVS
ncbi:ROK family transcriptional regulator [Leifsonia poae]|uniref:ROK family transcriptional regulator n=1 Tax=Leifsonia poae TaxID=110933 RepID=UPI001CBABE3C|nr:ROK family protein [Leifsonia poae]